MTIGTIAVLSDGGTFDMADDISIVTPNEKGMQSIEKYSDAASLENDDTIHNIPLRTILDFYNKHHGTNL
jgi:hypothetical protein